MKRGSTDLSTASMPYSGGLAVIFVRVAQAVRPAIKLVRVPIPVPGLVAAIETSNVPG